MAETHYSRHLETNLRNLLKDFPVVLLEGPRQCGKTTLVQKVGEKLGYDYVGFDEAEIFEDADADPTGFVADLPRRVILDEIQVAPRLFPAIKIAVDNKRTPGRFLLTGSVSVLRARGMRESLAGRMGLLQLHPLSQREISGKPPKFIDAIFSSRFKRTRGASKDKSIAHRVTAGGYPIPLKASARQRKLHWHDPYIQELMLRDIKDISRVRSPGEIRKLLTLASGETSQLVRADSLAKSFGLSRPTIQNYLALLEMIFLITTLPAWYSNHRKRLVKTPKLHIGDTGLACSLLNLDEAALKQDKKFYGQLFETFVLQELRRQAGAHLELHQFYHYRENGGKEAEVDIVISRGIRELVGVEVKLAQSVSRNDFRGLRRLQDAAGKSFKGGVVLYTGNMSRPMDEERKLWALPVQALWETESFI